MLQIYMFMVTNVLRNIALLDLDRDFDSKVTFNTYFKSFLGFS